jgi:histidinol-phosphatase (PHP family)
MPADYHTHTSRCKHATGSMAEYVAQAKAVGLSELGFSDHLPHPKGPSPWNMGEEELAGYCEEVASLRRANPGLPIRMAVEADYFPEAEAELKRLISLAPFDYVIGSVHYQKVRKEQRILTDEDFWDWGIDDPGEMEEWKRHQVDEVWREYLRQLRLSAASGLFTIIGHCDLAKKFGHRPQGDLSADFRATAEAFAKAKVLVELNTSGLRAPVGEIYPSQQFLAHLREAGVGICLGSDAHKPGDVGRALAEAREWARQAGYSQLQAWQAPGQFAAVAL